MKDFIQIGNDLINPNFIELATIDKEAGSITITMAAAGSRTYSGEQAEKLARALVTADSGQ